MTTKPKALKFRVRRTPVPSPVQPVAPGRAANQPGAAPRRAQALRGIQGGRDGEVSTPHEVASETDIEAIRHEGLTGRQLRMARRVAAKHGLNPEGDLEAVRELRLRGIDPFERANMLEVVAPGGLPAPAAKPAPVPSTEVLPAEARGREIAAIQRDIARRRRRRTTLLMVRLAAFVLLPTLLAGWYYARVATPMYATLSEFVIQQADAPAAGGLGGLFSGTQFATSQDSIAVQSYLESRDAMLRLDADEGFKAHFAQDAIDPLQRLEPDATNEAAYAVYQDRVKLGYDPTEGIIKMEVVAASPEASARFSQALISYAEERVDNLTQRLRADQMEGATDSFEAAEAKMREAQQEVIRLKELSGVVDGAGVVASRLQQVSTFELELRQKQLALESLLQNARPNQARVDGLRSDIASLESLIAEMQGEMTASSPQDESLARVSSELAVAEIDLSTRQVMLSQALQQLEAARIEANRQTRYLSLGVAPIPPDEATYPRVFENTLLAALVFAGIYLMLSLTASILREQVSS